MRFFDLFKKKNNSEVVKKEDLKELSQIIAKSFGKARYSDEKISQRLDHLYIKHETLHGKHNKNMDLMLSWFENFQNMHTEHKEEILALKGSMVKVQGKLENIEKIDEEFIKNIVEKYVIMPKEDKEELEEELFEELTSVREIQREREVITKEAEKGLTKSELELLSILYNSSIALSYIDIGRKLRKSPNTIKVYLNALKNKGIELEEHSAQRGIKLYSISNKEKVKKFYNFG